MGFIVELSDQKFEGVIASTLSISKAMFTQFAHDIWSEVNNSENKAKKP